MKTKKEEALQQARAFSLHQNAQRRASEVQRSPPQQSDHQQISRESRPSPSTSPASLPNNNGIMAPPINVNNGGNNNVVNTPQSMTANLPQQNNMPVRHTESPSFSPQQMQRGAEVMTQQPQTPHANEARINSPMTNQQLQQQQAMMRQHNAMVAVAMSTCGLAGRDHNTLTPEEKVRKT